jgi:hypothetical protein
MTKEVAHAFTPAGGDRLGRAPLYLYIQIKWGKIAGIQNTIFRIGAAYKANF